MVERANTNTGTTLRHLTLYHNPYRDAFLLAAYCGLIFYLSHQSTLPAPMLAFPHQDKFVHAAAYAVMGALAWRFFAYHTTTSHYHVMACLLFCSAYGVSDEYHQSFVAGRDADIWDWFADTLGAALMLSALWWRKQRGTHACRCR